MFVDLNFPDLLRSQQLKEILYFWRLFSLTIDHVLCSAMPPPSIFSRWLLSLPSKGTGKVEGSREGYAHIRVIYFGILATLHGPFLGFCSKYRCLSLL